MQETQNNIRKHCLAINFYDWFDLFYPGALDHGFFKALLTADAPATLDSRLAIMLIFIVRAGVAKLVYALDSKSSGLNAHVGSTPTLGTTPF